MVVQRGVWSVPVVVVQLDVEVLGALLGRLVGARVSPFAQGGLDEAFGLAVGARGVEPGVAMHEAEAAAEVLEGAGAVGGAVVGEDTADADAEAGVVAEGGEQGAASALGGFVGEDRGESDAAVVINRHMDVFPACATRRLAAVAGDAVAGDLEACEALDVQVQQVAGGLVLIAANRRGRLKAGQTAQASLPCDAGHGADADPQLLGDPAAGLALPSPLDYLLADGLRRAMRTAPGTGGAVMQPCPALLAVAPQPLVNGAHAHAHRLRHLGRPHALLQHALDQQHSSMNGQSGMLVAVHSGRPEHGFLHLQSSGQAPNEQPDEISQLGLQGREKWE